MYVEYPKNILINTLTNIVGNYLISNQNRYGVVDNLICESLSIHNKEVNILFNDKMFLLFKRITEDTQLNINSLIVTNEKSDNFRYVDIKRNTRSIIEAFIDMLNLFNDKNYIEIIKLNCNMYNVNKEKVKNILTKANIRGKYKFINIRRKLDILNQYEALEIINKEDIYKKIVEYLNKYAHPNIFIDEINKIQNCESLHKTLFISLECLDLSFCLLIMYLWDEVFKNKNTSMIYEFANRLSFLIDNCYSALNEWLMIYDGVNKSN